MSNVTHILDTNTADRAIMLYDRIKRSSQIIVVYYKGGGKFGSIKQDSTTLTHIYNIRHQIVGCYNDECTFGWLEADMIDAEKNMAQDGGNSGKK